MRIYDEKQRLIKVICNGCGEETLAENYIIKKDFLSVKKDWGYFSERDGETDQWDLCERCYEKVVDSFRIHMNISDTTELMNV